MLMIDDPVKNTRKEEINQLPDGLFTARIKNLETYAIIGIVCLIVAIVFISFGLSLIGGSLVLAGAALIVSVIKKASLIIRNLRESLHDAMGENEKQNKVISVFSHKIREPLNNLVIIIDMLMSSDLQKKHREMLDTFVASTNNMVSTVNELTMKSASGIKYGPRKNIKYSIIPTLKNTIELFSLKEDTNLDFILSRKDFSDMEFTGDPILLKQIFLDIFNNIEASAAKGQPVKVTISLKREKDLKNEIFIGFRIQTDKKIVLTDDKGIITLNALKLISSASGSFSQESGSNYTVMNIILPFINPQAEPYVEKAPDEAIAKKVRVRKELKDVRMLLVEDNLINQKITHLTLKPLVSSIDTASNGKEALEKFRPSGYDLILMDIQMPVMNGLIAAEKIREMEAGTGSHVPIIAITANAMLGDKEKCISAGIDDYISKPYQPALLIDKIKNIL